MPIGIRTQPGCLGNHKEGARGVARQLQQDARLPRVEIDWKEPVSSFHARGPRAIDVGDRRRCCLRRTNGARQQKIGETKTARGELTGYGIIGGLLSNAS